MPNERFRVIPGEPRYNLDRQQWEVELLDWYGRPIGHRALGSTRDEALLVGQWLAEVRRAEAAPIRRDTGFLDRLVAEHAGTLHPFEGLFDDPPRS